MTVRVSGRCLKGENGSPLGVFPENKRVRGTAGREGKRTICHSSQTLEGQGPKDKRAMEKKG